MSIEDEQGREQSLWRLLAMRMIRPMAGMRDRWRALAISASHLAGPAVRSSSLGLGMSAAQLGQMATLLAVGIALDHDLSGRLAFQVSAFIPILSAVAALALDRLTGVAELARASYRPSAP